MTPMGVCDICGRERGGPGESGKCWGGTAGCWQRGYERLKEELRVERQWSAEKSEALAERARAHAEGKAEGRREMADLLAALDTLCAAVRKVQYRLDRATFNSVVLPVLKAAEGCEDRIRSLIPAGPEVIK